ncbi:MAG: murein L,D-transpeptidase catalytic domain family protein [Bacteroidota bacterium]
MLKLTSYPGVLLFAILLMGHTKSSAPVSVAYAAAANPALAFLPAYSISSPSSFYEKAADYYHSWNLDEAGLSEAAFTYALKGYDQLTSENQVANKDILTIVDFSKSSTEKRLYVLDLVNGKILYNTLVAHGRNSGNEFASKFSNLPESHQSSLGFYITLNTYYGSNGYSMRLKGCEKGINDRATARAIVVHGADYVSNNFINSHGYLGRSYGCPSLPAAVNKEIINLTKNGSCLFLYHPSSQYTTRSKIINS